jgi:hypothetical protein
MSITARFVADPHAFGHPDLYKENSTPDTVLQDVAMAR